MNNCFNFVNFEQVVNDDILRIVLSYLNISELMILEVVSKKLRICQLTTEDYLWKDYYSKRVLKILENYKRHRNMGKSNALFGEGEFTQSKYTLLESYLNFKSEFKKNLINFGLEMKLECENSLKLRMNSITKLKQLKDHKIGFHKKEEILSYELIKTAGMKETYKVLQIGDPCVGKTCLFIRMSLDQFPTDYIPTVFDNFNFPPNENLLNIQYWDSVCCDDYDSYFWNYSVFAGVDLFVLSFSCGDACSMEHIISKWMPKAMANSPNVILIGTKTDLRNDSVFCKKRSEVMKAGPISQEEGELLARKLGCITYVETSALTGEGVKEVHEVITKVLIMLSTPKSRDQKCILQ